jgi:hypothetical protein
VSLSYNTPKPLLTPTQGKNIFLQKKFRRRRGKTDLLRVTSKTRKKMRNLLSYAALSAACLFGSIDSKAQMPYNVTTSTDAYVPLTNATNITANRLWSDTSDLNFPVGFNFQFAGSTINSLKFIQTSLFMKGNAGVQSAFAIFGTSLMDRSHPTGGTPVSPIQYKITGNTGSRIFKLEFKNAGFANEWDKNQTNDDSLNLQVWIYEQNSTVEFRFGPSHVSHYSDYFDQLVPLGYIRNIDMSAFSFEKFYYLKGNATAPTVDSVSDLSNPLGLNSFPASGTVYRFSLKSPTTSVGDHDEITLSKIYPNPMKEVLYIESKAGTYELISITGTQLMEGTIPNGSQKLVLNNLPAGTYILKLRDNRGQVNTQRIVKQ